MNADNNKHMYKYKNNCEFVFMCCVKAYLDIYVKSTP